MTTPGSPAGPTAADGGPGPGSPGWTASPELARPYARLGNGHGGGEGGTDVQLPPDWPVQTTNGPGDDFGTGEFSFPPGAWAAPDYAARDTAAPDTVADPAAGPSGPGGSGDGTGQAGGGAADASMLRSSGVMALGTLASRFTGFSAPPSSRTRSASLPRRRLQRGQHGPQRGLQPRPGRDPDQRRGTAAGQRGPAGLGPGRGLRPADLHPGRAGPGAVTVVATAAAGPITAVYGHDIRNAADLPPDPPLRLLLPAADLLLRGQLAGRGDPQRPRQLRRADVDPVINNVVVIGVGGAFMWSAGLNKTPAGHRRGRGRAAGPRHHAGHRAADRRPDPVAAQGGVPVAAAVRLPPRRGVGDRPDERLDVRLRR